MTKKIYFVAILFAFVMQSMSIWANTLSVSPVNMYRKYSPKLDGTPKPSKAPVNFSIPLSVFLDEDARQLIVTSVSDGDLDYCIYDENDEVISQGILSCNNIDDCVINLGFCSYGTYNIEVSYNEHVYEGTFILN